MDVNLIGIFFTMKERLKISMNKNKIDKVLNDVKDKVNEKLNQMADVEEQSEEENI